MAREIHKTAIVSSKSEIDEDVHIGPFCIIGEGATIKRGTKLMSNVVVEGATEIGEECIIYPFTSIGLSPQDLKYKDEKTGVKIGKKNIIREYITIHRASVQGDGLTEIKDSNFLMAYVHIAHDCKVGSSIVMANATTLGGHVVVEDFVVIGGMAAVHQFSRIGAYSMVGGFSGVGRDVPPYTMASGARARIYGLNIIGLKRHGFSEETINNLKKVYKILFREKRRLKDAIEKIRADLLDVEEARYIVGFIEENKRGICR